MLQTLRRSLRRRRGVLLVRGLLGTAAVALIALLAAMAVDQWTDLFVTHSRWALSLSVLGVTLVAAWWLLVRPQRRALTVLAVARAIESHHPELEERLSSAVELLASHDDPSIRGSGAMIAALADQAVEQRPHRPPLAGVFPPRGETLPLHPRSRRRGAGRADGDLAEHDLDAARAGRRAPLEHRAVHDPRGLPSRGRDGPRHRPAAPHRGGDALGVESAELRIATGSGDIVRVMEKQDAPAGLSRFALSLTPADAAFRYRVRSGHAITPYYRVRVVAPPVIESLDLHYAYPDYAAKPPEDRTNATGDILALAGTTVTVTAHLNKPVASAERRSPARPKRSRTPPSRPTPTGARPSASRSASSPRPRHLVAAAAGRVRLRERATGVLHRVRAGPAADHPHHRPQGQERHHPPRRHAADPVRRGRRLRRRSRRHRHRRRQEGPARRGPARQARTRRLGTAPLDFASLGITGGRFSVRLRVRDNSRPPCTARRRPTRRSSPSS